MMQYDEPLKVSKLNPAVSIQPAAAPGLGALDLNLLVVFAAVLKTRSTTLAADELDLSQSAVSNALRRLRNHFDDALFVKTADGMAPTPLAEKLAGPIHEGLNHIRQALEERREFVPAVSRRRFRIGTSDMGQLVLLPGLLGIAETEAPGVSLATVELGAREAQAHMARGEIDLAIGTFDDLDAGFHVQHLFTKEYVVMARDGNPAFAGGLTLERFLRARHARFQPAAGSHDTLEQRIDELFRRHGVQRLVVAEFGHALGIVQAVASTDLIVCVPKRLAEMYASHADVVIAPPPFDSPVVDISQYWHERVHDDAGHRWLRSVVFRRFGD